MDVTRLRRSQLRACGLERLAFAQEDRPLDKLPAANGEQKRELGLSRDMASRYRVFTSTHKQWTGSAGRRLISLRSVGKKDTAVDERLDALYREHPDGFVAGRNELAKAVRAAGDRDEAERIKKLRRPSAAAWLINRTALSRPEPLEELAEASRRLAEAQRRALEGDDDAVTDWRAAAAREREAIAAVVEAAAGLARDSGHSVNQRALELVGETLRAAAGDSDFRDRVMSGRVERERSAPTLGTPAVPPARRRDSGSAKRRELALAKRELERRRDELGEATAREERLRENVERTTETLRQDKARLAEAKRETAGLRRQVKAAERRAKE